MQFWLDKAVAWGQADSPDTQKDTCLHLSRLRDFLQQLITHINNMSSTTETMKTLPFLGQFLGRLCWNPYVTAHATSRRLLFQCLWGLYTEHPCNAVERKANQWIRKVLCQLATEDDCGAVQTLMKHVGVPPEEYHLKVLRKRVTLLQQNIGKSCSSLGDMNQRCSCDSLLAASEACVPLVTCPEAAPLIGALLQQPVTCVRAALSENFLDALSSAYSSQLLLLEEQAVVSLWYHSLSSLEEAVLRLLERVLTKTGLTLQQLKQQLTESLLVDEGTFEGLVPTVTSESAGASRDPAVRGHHKVFDAWFLLVQCAHWVQAAVQLLVTSGPEDCGPLLWLLTFYHHPTNRGHHRALQLVHAKEAWDHLRSLFVAFARPPPVDRLQSLVTLLSSQPQRPSPSPLLILSLLVNFAVFFQQPLSGSTEILQTV
ncbi:Fanconi anemia group C protein-like protein, partial [Nibea albiflora]